MIFSRAFFVLKDTGPGASTKSLRSLLQRLVKSHGWPFFPDTGGVNTHITMSVNLG